MTISDMLKMNHEEMDTEIERLEISLKDREVEQRDIANSEEWLEFDHHEHILEMEGEQEAEFISGYIHAGGCQFDAKTEWNQKNPNRRG